MYISDEKIKEINSKFSELQKRNEELLRESAINYGLSQTIRLSIAGDSSENSMIDVKYQVERACIEMIRYYFKNSKSCSCQTLDKKIYLTEIDAGHLQFIKRSNNMNTHAVTKYINCDLVLKINDKIINFEVDSKRLHCNEIDQAKDNILNDKGIEVIRIKCKRVNLRQFLIEKLPLIIAEVRNFELSDDDYGTIEI